MERLARPGPAMRLALLVVSAAWLGACATAPPAPAARQVSYEQKMAWIFALEDQRILRIPEPPQPEPAAVGGRRAAAPPPPSATADLTALAADPEPRVRRRAAVAIGRVGLREGVPALTALLADPDTEIRQAAAFALGLIGDRSAAPALVPLLTSPDPLVRGRAAEALGRVGADDAAAAIGNVAAEYARSAAVAAMTPDDESWPAAPEAEGFRLALFALVRLQSYDPLAAAVLGGDGLPVSSWWPVAYALQRVNDPRAATALKHLLAVEGRYTPAFAARGLGELKDAAALDALLALADPEKRPREVVASAVRAVRQIGDARAASRMADIAANTRVDPGIRLEAVETLGALRAEDELPLVQDLITDPWPAMRAAALRAAAAIDPDTFTLILSGLQVDTHWLGRAALADALGQLERDIALERLHLMLDDPDRRVIPSVLRALVRVEAPDAAKIALAHLEQDDFVIRETAAGLVGELRPAGGLDALRAAYERGEADAAYSARAAALEAMAAYGAEAAGLVRAGLADRDWPVRVRALDLLETLEPGTDYRHEIRPAPASPIAAYEEPQLLAPPYSPRVFIETEKGSIEFELAVLDAPQTARNFIALARKGFFNGLPIHRAVPNFVVQDGDPRGDGKGGPGYTIRDELNDRPYLRGTVGMALAWRDTGGSQFFITHSPQPHLDGRYTAFGTVVNGMEVVDRLQVGDVIQRIRVWDGTAWE